MNTSTSSLPNPNFHRRTGKVARLPKATRDKINHMLQDGIPYRDIIQILGPEVIGLTEENICTWKAGGYQDWLTYQERLAQLRRRQDQLTEALAGQDTASICQSALRMAAISACEVLAQMDSSALLGFFEANPERYARILQAAARISNAQLQWARHRAAGQRNQLPPHPTFEEMARILGF